MVSIFSLVLNVYTLQSILFNQSRSFCKFYRNLKHQKYQWISKNKFVVLSYHYKKTTYTVQVLPGEILNNKMITISIVIFRMKARTKIIQVFQ